LVGIARSKDANTWGGLTVGILSDLKRDNVYSPSKGSSNCKKGAKVTWPLLPVQIIKAFKGAFERGFCQTAVYHVQGILQEKS